jgi:hypothetical protein
MYRYDVWFTTALSDIEIFLPYFVHDLNNIYTSHTLRESSLRL